MNIIVAVDKNWAIGKENKLLVSIPADMKFFRSTTTGKRQCFWQALFWGRMFFYRVA